MNATTLNIVQGTIKDIRYVLEPLGRDKNLTFLGWITAFIGNWSKASYHAWEISGKIETLYFTIKFHKLKP